MPVPVPPPQRGVLAGGVQAFLPELAQGLRQPVPGHARAMLGGQDRLAGQRGQQVQHLSGGQPVIGADALGRVQLEPAGEHRQPRPQQPLRLAAQLITPLDRGPQRLLPGRARAAAPGQQAQPVAQPGVDLLRGQHPGLRRGQLDGQRQPVQPAADPGHRRTVRLGHREPRHHLRGPLGEQPHRREHPQPCRRQRLARLRHRQRRHRQHHLAVDNQRFPAGGQHPQPGRRPQQQVRQLGGGVHQVLAVIQHQQQLPAREVAGQRRLRRKAGPVLQAQRARDRVGHQRLLPQLVQPDQPHPAGKRPSQLGGGPQRQPGLADPADPGQRHQPGPGQQPPDLGQLTAAAGEAGQLGRQIPRYARSRCHDTSAPGISRKRSAQALPLNAQVPRHRRCSLLRRKITCDHGRAPGGPAAPVKVPGRLTGARAAHLRLNHAAARH